MKKHLQNGPMQNITIFWFFFSTMFISKLLFFFQILVNYDDFRKRVSTIGSFCYITIKTEDYLIKRKCTRSGNVVKWSWTVKVYLTDKYVSYLESIFDRQVRTYLHLISKHRTSYNISFIQVRTHTSYRRTMYILNECNIQLRSSCTSVIAWSKNSTMRKFHNVNWKHISLLW